MKEAKKQITIADIAKASNASPATVSRVLNGKPGVGIALRKQILACIEEHNYTPNTLAQSLVKGKINIVGLILGDIRNPFYADLSFYIQRVLDHHGYMVVTFNSEHDVKTEIECIDLANKFNFAGLILITAQSDELHARIKKLDIPVVLVNRIFDDYAGSYVSVDNFQSGYLAGKHLIELGYPTLSFISGNMSSSAIRQRYNGFIQVQRNYQIHFDSQTQFFLGDLKDETGRQIAQDYVANYSELPKAVVVSNDTMAIGFLDQCRSMGVSVPGDLSIVSFDNIKLSNFYSIGLTTIDNRSQTMGEEAARLILKHIHDPDAKPEKMLLEPQLIIRNSTAPYNSISGRCGT